MIHDKQKYKLRLSLDLSHDDVLDVFGYQEAVSINFICVESAESAES